MDKKIKFYQLNCDTRIVAEASLPAEADTVLLLQEPRLVNGKPQVLRRQKFFCKEDGRAAIYVPNLVKATFMVLPTFVRRDLVAGLLECEDHSMIIASVYFHEEVDVLQPDLVELVEHCKANNLPLLCGADTNAWSHLWFSNRENKRGRKLLEYMMSEGISVCNDYAVPTYVAKGPNGQVIKTTVDVTFTVNCRIDVENWKVHSDRCISDHKPITFNISCAGVPKAKSRNFYKADWKKFHDIIQSELPTINDGAWSTMRIEKEVEVLYKYIYRAMDIVCPLRNCKSKKEHPWWNEECETKKNALRSVERKLRKMRHSKVLSEEEWESLKLARRQYSGAIHAARRKAWREFTSSIDTISEMAKLNKIITTKPAEEVGLLRKADGTICHNSEETLRVLLDEHFPDCRIGAKLECEPSRVLHTIDNVPWINSDTVKAALQEFGDHKAPGIDNIKPIVLKHLPQKAINRLVEIYRACVSLKYTPKCWRTSKVVFMFKPGKTDKSHPRSYRPLSLTSFFFKNLEKTVKFHLEDDILPYYPRHKDQFAFQKDLGTDHALSKTVNEIERGLFKMEFVMVILLDIKGAFDNILPNAINQSMIDSNIPELIRAWYYNYLTNRDCESSLGKSTTRAVLKKGCPQGAVLSPPLGWSPSMDKFLYKFEHTPVKSAGFADDGALVITGIEPEIIRDFAQDAIVKAVEWADEHGLTFSPSKTAVLFLTRRRKYKLPPKLTMYGTEIDYSKEAKYLGVTLDSNLNWSTHIENKIKSTKRIMMMARNALAHTWGPHPRFMHWLYTAVIRPRITYGSFVWGEAALKKGNQDKLRSLQRLGLHMIAPIRRGTPSKALEIIYNVEPLHLHIQSLSLSASL